MATYDNIRAVVIPQVYGLPSQRVADRINQRIRVSVRRLLKEQGYGRPHVGIWTEHSVELNDLGVLSLYYDAYAFKDPSAHGLTVRTSLSFNEQTAQVYTLQDLFRSGSDYIERVSELIQKQIKEQGIPLIKEFERISANQSFYLTRDALVIYFQTYEYTPYFVGIPEFPILYSSLRKLLNPTGPAARFLTGN